MSIVPERTRGIVWSPNVLEIGCSAAEPDPVRTSAAISATFGPHGSTKALYYASWTGFPDDQIRRLDTTLAQQWGHDLRVQRLMTIPGIGRFLAVLLVLELGDVQRFPSGKHLARYIGLTPRIRASADRVRSGHISKEGNRLLRWGLGLAATQAAYSPLRTRSWNSSAMWAYIGGTLMPCQRRS